MQKLNNSCYEKGFFSVSKKHKLYYERCGNKRGIPVVFLHGGPGSGFNDGHKELFDFKKFNVLFYDQRGAGRSKPFACILDNTTQDLVDDLVRLLDHFNLEKVLIFGGSWGSTLALVFAIKYPERVSALILRGIFLANQESIKHYLGGGVASYAPEAWDRFQSQFPKLKANALIEAYYRKFKSKERKVRSFYAKEWARFEMSILTLADNPAKIEQLLKVYKFESLAILECHYLRKLCFLSENYILKNVNRINKIPVSIVHGRYDLVCPPKGAHQLASKLNSVRLKFVCAGHASSEPEIKLALKSELNYFAGKFKN